MKSSKKHNAQSEHKAVSLQKDAKPLHHTNDPVYTSFSGTNADTKACQGDRLAELERLVVDGRDSMAEAIHKIKRDKLYRLTHSRWSDYVAERFGFSVDWADDLVLFVEIREKLGQLSIFPPPTNPGQARELAGLDDAELVQAWGDVHKKAKGGHQITAALIRDLIKARTGKDDAHVSDDSDQQPQNVGDYGPSNVNEVYAFDWFPEPVIETLPILGETEYAYVFKEEDGSAALLVNDSIGEEFFWTEHEAKARIRDGLLHSIAYEKTNSVNCTAFWRNSMGWAHLHLPM